MTVCLQVYVSGGFKLQNPGTLTALYFLLGLSAFSKNKSIMAVYLLNVTTIVSFSHNSDSQKYSFNKE